MSRRHLSSCLAVAVLSGLVALGALEVGLRLFWVKRWTISSGLEDPHFHHRMKPSSTYRYATDEFDVTIRTNRFGLRGPEPTLPKPPGTTRILMLGDSYTFGFPVKDEEVFCALAERALRDDGYPAEVVNGGVSGYSPTLEYVSLRDDFLRFEPDLVILWYDLGDLQDDYRYQRNLRYDATGRIVGCDPRYVHGRFDWGEWWSNHSALAKYVRTKPLRTVGKIRILGLRGYLGAKLRGERAKVAIAQLKQSQRAEDILDYEGFLLVRESTTRELAEHYWPLSGRYLTLIRDLLAERGIPFAIGIYPYGMVVGPNQWAQGRVPWGFEQGKTYDASLALSVFREFSEAQRIPLIDTFDRFRAAGRTQKLFYDWDGHLTPAGHRVIAEHLVNDRQFRAMLRRAMAGRRHASAEEPHES